MPQDNALIAFAAIVCVWMVVWIVLALIYWMVRYVVRREIKRALTGLRSAKFALTIRDPKTGRFVK